MEDHIKEVYAASSSGLDIILSVCPQAADAVNSKRAFKLRLDERTASAHLYQPDGRCNYWHVVDYGLGEGERRLSPIDLYMQDRGYSQSQFALALHELMEEYGVAEELSAKVNRPEIEYRTATADDAGKAPRVELREGFTAEELAVWGPHVKAEHLEELGWKAVTKVEITKGDKVIVKKATPTYPIFAQTCTYINDDGQETAFLKLYEPKNPNKAYRFSIVGTKPRHYIFGLNALRRKFSENGDTKLPTVVIVSGGSDAVNALSLGYQPVGLGSETEGLSDADFHLLLKYAKRIVNIPDIDATGIKVGRQLALRIPELFTAWMTPKDMGGLHDNRGRQRKDLKDFIQLNPGKKAMQRLIDRALSAKFITVSIIKDGPLQYSIQRARLDYFLQLNGFCTLKDDQRTEPVYIRIEGNVVSRTKAKSIAAFMTEWCEQQGIDEDARCKLLRSHDLPNNQSTTLRQRDDLDFTTATASSQRFYFRNGWVEVTAEGCTKHRYAELTDRYVWADSIISHDYAPMQPMFTVERSGDGLFTVVIPEEVPSKFMRFVVNASRIYWRKADEQGLELTDDERAEEQQSLASKLAAIGYLLHRYKSESAAWAIICQDTTMGENEDECNGRSGKSFFLKAVSQLLSAFPIEARVPSIVDNRFIFDGVTEATDLIIVDECHKQLNFDYFFGKITGDLRYEEKGNHPMLLPFARSPKFAFATNYVLRRHDPSTEGRLWPQVFSDYYHVRTPKNDYRATRTIRDDIGCNLFGNEYPEADWQADIAFMMQCLQFYLSLPVEQRRIMPPMGRVERREQRAAIGRDFEQWANEYFAPEGGNLDRDLKANDVLTAYNAEASFKKSMTWLTQHLKAYCEYAQHISCLNPATVTGRKTDGEPWVKREENAQVRYYYVKSADNKAATQATAAPTDSPQEEKDLFDEIAEELQHK